MNQVGNIKFFSNNICETKKTSFVSYMDFFVYIINDATRIYL